MFTSIIQNAFLLFKSYHDKHKKYDSRQFIESLLQEIAEAAHPSDSSDSSDSEQVLPISRNQHRRQWWIDGPGASIRLKGRNHWPQHAGNTCFTEDESGEKKIDLRRYCMYHAHCGRVLTYCTKCLVPLCLAHFESFHTHTAQQFPLASPQ
jgi:hypothetical protein